MRSRSCRRRRLRCSVARCGRPCVVKGHVYFLTALSSHVWRYEHGSRALTSANDFFSLVFAPRRLALFVDFLGASVFSFLCVSLQAQGCYAGFGCLSLNEQSSSVFPCDAGVERRRHARWNSQVSCSKKTSVDGLVLTRQGLLRLNVIVLVWEVSWRLFVKGQECRQPSHHLFAAMPGCLSRRTYDA